MRREGWGEGLLGVVYPAVLAVSSWLSVLSAKSAVATALLRVKRLRVELPIDVSSQVWQAATTMNDSEKRFSLTRAALTTRGRKKFDVLSLFGALGLAYAAKRRLADHPRSAQYERAHKKHILISLTAIPLLAIAVICLLANGCATTSNRTLTRDELRILKQPQTVLIAIDGVNGKQKDFFLQIFKSQLSLNAATTVIPEKQGEPAANYDAVITLKCYYFDDKQYALRMPADIPSAVSGFGGKSATGVGKRIGCRVTIVHKQLGQLFAGDIGGRTPAMQSLSPDEALTVLATPGAYSAYLEARAQRNFKSNLEWSQAWFVVKRLGPNN